MLSLISASEGEIASIAPTVILEMCTDQLLVMLGHRYLALPIEVRDPW
jgi:hypothetical protein